VESVNLKTNLQKTVELWIVAWNAHDLNTVMALFHDDAQFISWTGQCFTGKKRIRRAWTNWFKNHGDFVFSIEYSAVDTSQSIVTFGWQLVWPSQEPAYRHQKEIRHGIDILHFHEGLIVSKKSYCRTVLSIDGREIQLHL